MENFQSFIAKQAMPFGNHMLPRKSDLQNIATYASSMGAHTGPTIPVNANGTRKTELQRQVSTSLRKAEKEAVLLTRTLRS
jgi:hypothetical protein